MTAQLGWSKRRFSDSDQFLEDAQRFIGCTCKDFPEYCPYHNDEPKKEKRHNAA